MELTPILDFGNEASLGMWYLLATAGDGPCPRVGHACCLFTTSVESDKSKDKTQTIPEGKRNKLVIVAGATPAGSFSDVYFLELCDGRYKWEKGESEGLMPRYEHGIMETAQGDIYVFGGAQQSENLNSIQVLKKGDTKWVDVSAAGCIPAPRTVLNVASINSRLYIFGGGLQGARPVTDTQLHVFDADNSSWTQVKCNGTPPSPRHGHLMVALDRKIFIHGGMAEADLYSDLHVLDLDTNGWHEIKQSGNLPVARAAHAGTVVDRFIYIFGGMSFTGALNDLYKFDSDFLVWSKIEINGCPPPPRLDHTLCCIDHPIKGSNENLSLDILINYILTKNGDTPASEVYKTQKLLLSFGGMDTSGQIFDDLFVIPVE